MVNRKKELFALEAPQARQELNSARRELQSLRIKAASADLKNVRAIRQARTTVARLATRLRQLKASPHP